MKSYYEDNRVSQSRLKDFVLCPNYYKLKHVDKVIKESPSKDMIYGSIVDALITQPEELENDYHFVEKKPRGKEFDEEGRRYVNQKVLDLAKIAEKRLKSQPVWEKFSWMDNQVALYTKQCKALLDFFAIDEKGVGHIADLKTIRDVNEIDTLFVQYMWKFQLMFYRFLAKQVYPEVKQWEVHLIGIDKTKAMNVGVWKIPATAYNAYETNFKNLLHLVGRDFKVSKGFCQACPAEYDCRYSKFTERDIKNL